MTIPITGKKKRSLVTYEELLAEGVDPESARLQTETLYGTNQPGLVQYPYLPPLEVEEYVPTITQPTKVLKYTNQMEAYGDLLAQGYSPEYATWMSADLKEGELVVSPAMDVELWNIAKERTPEEAYDYLRLQGYEPSTVKAILGNAGVLDVITEPMPYKGTPELLTIPIPPEDEDDLFETRRAVTIWSDQAQAINRLPDLEQFGALSRLGYVPPASEFVPATEDEEWTFRTPSEQELQAEMEKQRRLIEANRASIEAVFPGQEVEAVIEMATTEPYSFIAAATSKGWSVEVEDMLKVMGASEEEIDNLFDNISDEQRLYWEYKRTGGRASFREWIALGSPLRTELGEKERIDELISDEQRLYWEYLRTGGTLTPEEWVWAGMPLRSEPEEQRRVDEVRIYREFLRDGGLIDIEGWRRIGSPIRSITIPHAKSNFTRTLESEWGKELVVEVATSLKKPYAAVRNEDVESFIAAHPEVWAQVEERQREFPSLTLQDDIRILAGSLSHLPARLAVGVLQASGGYGGSTVTDKGWARNLIETLQTEPDKFVQEIAKEYEDRPSLLGLEATDLAQVSQNMAFSIVSMGAGLGVGVPIALIPLPGARAFAYIAGTAASGAVAYNITAYQIGQEYLELKNDEMIAKEGRGITSAEEKQLKEEFASLAMQYGLWEAIPEAISNLAFISILGGPLTRMFSKSIATRILQKVASMYGQEFLTETITQKGQSDVEVAAGLREGSITWLEAFKEVAPQTFLLTTLMAGAGQVIISSSQALGKAKQSLKDEISEEHPLYAEFEGNLDVEFASDIAEQARQEIEIDIAEVEAVTPEVAPVTEGVKEPWQMTREEFLQTDKAYREQDAQASKLAQARGDLPPGSSRARVTTANARWTGAAEEREFMRRDLEVKRKQLIQNAISEGKPVPAEVLAEYPDLVKAEATPPVTEGVTKLTPDELQNISDIVDRGVFKETVSQSIQRDGQRLLDAVNKGDTKTIEAIQQKYAREAHMGVTGAAGPGKVKQGRIGSEDIWSAATIALKKDAFYRRGYIPQVEVTPVTPEVNPDEVLTVGQSMAVKTKYRASKEGKYLFKKWDEAKEKYGAGSQEALAFRDHIVKEEEAMLLAEARRVAIPKAEVAPVTPEVTISLDSGTPAIRQVLVKLFGEGKRTITSTEFWAKNDALTTRLAKLKENTPTWKSVKYDLDWLNTHIEQEGITREVTPYKVPTGVPIPVRPGVTVRIEPAIPKAPITPTEVTPPVTELEEIGIEEGDYIGSLQFKGQFREPTGTVVGEGTLGKPGIPAWTIEKPDGTRTAILKDDARIIQMSEEHMRRVAQPVEEVARLSEQVKAKLEAQEAYKQKISSVEAEMKVNRENNLKAVTAPRQEGEIPRQTVRHPSHYRGMEDFNVEVKRELLTAIPESPLDIAATEYLKTGDFSKYIEAMPDVSELKLEALSTEVHQSVEELQILRGQAVQLRLDPSFFDGLIDKAKLKKLLTIDEAVALGVALRETKGGKLVAAVRRSGFYVTEEFVDSPYLQNVSYQSGFWQDIDTLFESIDGGRAAGTPDAPAVAQKYIQRPSNRNFLAYKRWLDTYFLQAQERFEQFGLIGRISKQKWADVFNTIEQITAKEADFNTAQLLGKTEISDLLATYDTETKTNIVEFAQWSRAFLDEMRGFQNEARVKRNQKEIGYIDKYMAWVAERNIWSSLGFSQRTPADMQVKAPAPDYIFPDAPFNPRAMTREGGMKNYTLEKNVHKLIFDYIRTAGKDIFFTNTVQNNKIHIAALKAKGLNSTAQLLEEYNAEVWAGAKPRITKAYEAFLPSKIAKATYMIRRQLTRAVFPLNWIWNITIQPSSIAFTTGRTGFINTFKGMDFLYLPSARAFVGDTYTYIIKNKRAGKMAFQDIGRQVEESLRFEGSIIDKAEYYASFITNTIETLLTGVSIRAGYYKGMKLGFTGQELVEYASKMGAKTQSMYNFENSPAVLRSKAVGTLFPFQTFTIQAMNYVREMNFIRVGKAGAYETLSASSAEGKATISGRLKLTAAFLVTILVINMVIDRLTNRKPWVVSSFIPMFSILGAGFEPGDAWNLPLPIKYVNDFWRGFNDVIKYDDFTKLRKWVLTYHFFFGGSQINRMIDGADAVARGVVTDVKGQEKFEVRKDEWLKAIFMGPYQTEGGREYIERLDEKNEKKAKWYEYLDIPILIGRVDINSEIETNLTKLGEIDDDGMRYDFSDLASGVRDIRQSVGQKRFDKSVSPILDGFKKAEVARENYENLPPEKLINMDEYDISDFLFPELDEKDAEITALWTRFNTAKTKEERLEVIKEYMNVNKEVLKDNNLVENYGLLEDYWSLIGKDKAAFAEKYDVLTKEWRSEWRLNSPEDDALLAMWGYGGKIQTQEAYDFIKKWSEEYGVDLAHLSTWLPPEGSEENYFKYQAEVLERSWNSWEAQLILAKDDNLREALGIDPIDTPIASLELKTETTYRETYDKLNKEGDPNWIGLLDDKVKDANGLTARDRERDKLMDTKIPGTDLTYRDMERKVKAIEKGTDTKLIDDDLVTAYVDWKRIADAPGVGANSAESMIVRVDNPDLDAFLTDETIWGKDALKPIDESRIPIWRIDVKYAKDDAEYQTILDDNEGKEESAATRDYLFPEGQPTEYCLKRYERKALQADIPTTYSTGEGNPISDYVTWHTNPDLKKPGTYEEWEDWYAKNYPNIKMPTETKNIKWYDDLFYLQENSEFYTTMVDKEIWKEDEDKFKNVPTKRVYQLYLKCLTIPEGTGRRIFEGYYSDLDMWLHEVFGTNLEYWR